MRKYFGAIILYLVFIMIWIFIALISFLAYNYAMFTCFEDLYGIWSLWLGMVITILAILSPLYIRLLKIKEWKTALISIFISILFVVIAFGSYSFTISQFKEFTPVKWEQYPRQRAEMLEDLKVTYSVIGMTEAEATLLLGKPDEISKDDFFLYYYEYGYIRFILDDGDVTSVENIDYF